MSNSWTASRIAVFLIAAGSSVACASSTSQIRSRWFDGIFDMALVCLRADHRHLAFVAFSDVD